MGWALGAGLLVVLVAAFVFLSARAQRIVAARESGERERQVAPPAVAEPSKPVPATLKASGPLLKFDKDGVPIAPHRDRPLP